MSIRNRRIERKIINKVRIFKDVKSFHISLNGESETDLQNLQNIIRRKIMNTCGNFFVNKDNNHS